MAHPAPTHLPCALCHGGATVLDETRPASPEEDWRPTATPFAWEIRVPMSSCSASRWRRARRQTEGVDTGVADLAKGVDHCQGARERQAKKRRGLARPQRQLQAHLCRWRAADGEAATHVIEWNGKPISSIKRMWREARERAGPGPEVTPHTLKHTAVTWAFQRGISLEDAADGFSTTVATLERVDRQHGPYHPQRAVAVMEKRAG